MIKQLLNNIEDWQIFCRSHQNKYTFPPDFSINSPINFPCVLVYSPGYDGDGNYLLWEFVYYRDLAS